MNATTLVKSRMFGVLSGLTPEGAAARAEVLAAQARAAGVSTDAWLRGTFDTASGALAMRAGLMQALIEESGRFMFRPVVRTGARVWLEFFESDPAMGATWAVRCQAPACGLIESGLLPGRDRPRTCSLCGAFAVSTETPDGWTFRGDADWNLARAQAAGALVASKDDEGEGYDPAKDPLPTLWRRALAEGARAWCAPLFNGAVYGEGEVPAAAPELGAVMGEEFELELPPTSLERQAEHDQAEAESDEDQDESDRDPKPANVMRGPWTSTHELPGAGDRSMSWAEVLENVANVERSGRGLAASDVIDVGMGKDLQRFARFVWPYGVRRAWRFSHRASKLAGGEERWIVAEWDEERWPALDPLPSRDGAVVRQPRPSAVQLAASERPSPELSEVIYDTQPAESAKATTTAKAQPSAEEGLTGAGEGTAQPSPATSADASGGRADPPSESSGPSAVAGPVSNTTEALSIGLEAPSSTEPVTSAGSVSLKAPSDMTPDERHAEVERRLAEQRAKPEHQALVGSRGAAWCGYCGATLTGPHPGKGFQCPECAPLLDALPNTDTDEGLEAFKRFQDEAKARKRPRCRECGVTRVDVEGVTCQACIDKDDPLPGDEGRDEEDDEMLSAHDEIILSEIKAGRFRVDLATGYVYGVRKETPLGTRTARGYLRTAAYAPDRVMVMVHRIVCIAAHGPAPAVPMDVNHKNGIKDDNRAENLEWATSSENARHAIRAGLRTTPRGESHPGSRLTEDDVRAIRSRSEAGESVRSLANAYGMARGGIAAVIDRKTWKGVAPLDVDNAAEWLAEQEREGDPDTLEARLDEALIDPSPEAVALVGSVAQRVSPTAEFTGKRLMTMKPSKRGGWCALCDREINVAESYYAGDGKRRAHSACVAAARSVPLPGAKSGGEA